MIICKYFLDKQCAFFAHCFGTKKPPILGKSDGFVEAEMKLVK